MMTYYILREVPEGRGLLANTVYSGQQNGPLVTLNTSRATTVTIDWRYVREVHFLDGLIQPLQPPPCPPMPEQPGKYMVLKLNDPVTYLSYDAAVTAAKLYANTTHHNHKFRVVRVLADVAPPTASVVTVY